MVPSLAAESEVHGKKRTDDIDLSGGVEAFLEFGEEKVGIRANLGSLAVEHFEDKDDVHSGENQDDT